MDRWLLAASTLCFLAAFVQAVLELKRGRERHANATLAFMGVGFVFQCAFLYLRGEMHGRCPITSFYEILIFVSWSTVLLYLILGRSFRLSLLGVFTAPLAFVLQISGGIALLLAEDLPHPPEHLDPWLEMHASMSLVAYGAFALAGVAGVMYLVQDRLLKAKAMNSLFYNLPPIRYLLQAIVRLLAIGLIILTLGIVSAFLMENRPTASHFLLSMAVWLLYGLLLVLYWRHRLVPRRFAEAAVLAFALPILTLVSL